MSIYFSKIYITNKTEIACTLIYNVITNNINSESGVLTEKHFIIK